MLFEWRLAVRNVTPQFTFLSHAMENMKLITGTIQIDHHITYQYLRLVAQEIERWQA